MNHVTHLSSGRKISYDAIRKAMKGKPFPMSLTGEGEIRAIIKAVNIGIDSCLEACNCPERGDSYEGGERRAGKYLLCRTLECNVSVESLPVLLRRLGELAYDESNDADMEAETLGDSILYSLGFNDVGKYVGRKALGLD